MDGWWDDIEREVLGCLSAAGELPCGELAAKLGMSEEAVASVLRAGVGWEREDHPRRVP